MLSGVRATGVECRGGRCMVLGSWEETWWAYADASGGVSHGLRNEVVLKRLATLPTIDVIGDESSSSP